MLLHATNQKLTGNVIADGLSDVTITLAQGSTLSGAINGEQSAQSVSVSLDASSVWTLTGDSTVTTIDDSAGLSGSAVTNIVGNGHTLSYSAAANPSLGGKGYTLTGSGTLTPR